MTERITHDVLMKHKFFKHISKRLFITSDMSDILCNKKSGWYHNHEKRSRLRLLLINLRILIKLYGEKIFPMIFIRKGAQDKLSGMPAPVYCFFITCFPFFFVFKQKRI